jgi:hypothetical protein
MGVVEDVAAAEGAVGGEDAVAPERVHDAGREPPRDELRPGRRAALLRPVAPEVDGVEPHVGPWAVTPETRT